MRVNLVVAVSANNIIGADGELPWRLPDDLGRFKAVTMGHPIVMGRKTYDSIGRALPGRQNIVVTRNATLDAPGCDVVSSPAAAIDAAGDAPELMVIGGGQLYREFLPRAERIFLTQVNVRINGDASFPELDMSQWQVAAREAHAADERHAHAFEFRTLQRVEAGR